MPARTIHKVTGLCLVAPVLLLVVTGIPLELSDRLGLGRTGVPYEWVHARYGISAPNEAHVVGDAIELGDLLLVHQRAIENFGNLLAAKTSGDLTFILTSDEWILVPTDSTIPVERGTYPNPISQATFVAGLPMLATEAGIITSTDYGASWHPALAPVPNWSKPERVAVLPRWHARYAASVLTWERWLQDLHSGRFFGTVGQWIMTFASLAFVLLAITGTWVWIRSLRR